MGSDKVSESQTERSNGAHIFLVGRLFILKIGTTLLFTLGETEDSFHQELFHGSILTECETAEAWRNKGTVSHEWGDYSPYHFHQIFAMERDDVSGNFLFVVVKTTNRYTAEDAISSTELFTQEMSSERANRLLAFLMDRPYL